MSEDGESRKKWRRTRWWRRSAHKWWKKFRHILGLNRSKKKTNEKKRSQLKFRMYAIDTVIRNGWKELDRPEDREEG